MILGIGTDLVNIARIERAIERSPRFLNLVFHPREQLEARGRPECLAARFAAKEAWLKAMGLPLFAVRLTEVFTVSDESGKPALRLEGRAADISRERGVRTMHLSLAHEGTVAIAFVVLEGEQP